MLIFFFRKENQVERKKSQKIDSQFSRAIGSEIDSELFFLKKKISEIFLLYKKFGEIDMRKKLNDFSKTFEIFFQR